MKQAECKFKLTGFDDLFGTDTPPQDISRQPIPTGNQVIELSLDTMHPFKNHPFRVLNDFKMAETVESVRLYGILQPGIVRPDPNGGYEIVAGHRRQMASNINGFTTMPVIIKNLTDDEATVLMVDSNIQREDLLYSEKAFAYKMKMAAQKRLTKLNSTSATPSKRSDQTLAEQFGESRAKIQRYIRLTYLIPELLEMVDIKRLGFTAGENISYLTHSEQKSLLDYIADNNVIPSGKQSEALKEYSKKGTLNCTVLDLVLLNDESAAPQKVTLNHKTLQHYFPNKYGQKEMETVIFQLLEEWHNTNIF